MNNIRYFFKSFIHANQRRVLLSIYILGVSKIKFRVLYKNTCTAIVRNRIKSTLIAELPTDFKICIWITLFDTDHRRMEIHII